MSQFSVFWHVHKYFAVQEHSRRQPVGYVPQSISERIPEACLDWIPDPGGSERRFC